MPYHTLRGLLLQAKTLLWSKCFSPKHEPWCPELLCRGKWGFPTSACQKKRGATHSDLLTACLRETLWEEGLANKCSWASPTSLQERSEPCLTSKQKDQMLVVGCIKLRNSQRTGNLSRWEDERNVFTAEGLLLMCGNRQSKQAVLQQGKKERERNTMTKEQSKFYLLLNSNICQRQLRYIFFYFVHYFFLRTFSFI